MRIQARQADASLFIVGQPEAPPQLVKWNAILRGCVVASREFISDRGGGAGFKFLPAIAKRRSIFMTDAFIAAHGCLADVVDHAAAATGSNWRMIRSAHAYTAARVRVINKPIRLQRHFDVVALILPIERCEAVYDAMIVTRPGNYFQLHPWAPTNQSTL